MAGDPKSLPELLVSLRHDPLKYCLSFFPWGEAGELNTSKGPRQWQREVLMELGEHLKNPLTRHKPFKLAVASGHGIGKSAMISMVCEWALSTCVDTKIVITANTEKQLMTKTVPEVTKWFRLASNAMMFHMTATAAYSAIPKHEKTWRADAIPWSENNTEAFAGLHNVGRRVVMIFDEGSSIADKVWEVAEGALTDADTEIIWLAFGNPTRNTGRFRDCFGAQAHRWRTRKIDSRTVEGTNKEQIQQWVDDYGEDSDFVRVRVRGEFPRSGSTQFISSELAEAARRREAVSYLNDPFTMAVDVARFGDDMTVISHLRGSDARSIPWTKLRGASVPEVADVVNDLWRLHQHDAVFVDEDGVGGGVLDILRRYGVPAFGVQGNSRATRGRMSSEGDVAYANKRAECWGYMKDALKRLALPNDADLVAQLCSIEYGYVMREGRDAILMEAKKDMKRRGMASPDLADSLAYHFATPIAPRDHTPQLRGNSKSEDQYKNYHPLARSVARGVRR